MYGTPLKLLSLAKAIGKTWRIAGFKLILTNPSSKILRKLDSTSVIK